MLAGGVSRRAEAALLKITGAGGTLAEKISACRDVPAGVPAELLLSRGVPVPDVEAQLGPPASKFEVVYPYNRKTVEFYTYGNLDVGRHGGEIIIVRVR